MTLRPIGLNSTLILSRPIISSHKGSKIIVIGQAPGAVVNRTGIPWDYKSGANLRAWMHISIDVFYDTQTNCTTPSGLLLSQKGSNWRSSTKERMCPPLA